MLGLLQPAKARVHHVSVGTIEGEFSRKTRSRPSRSRNSARSRENPPPSSGRSGRRTQPLQCSPGAARVRSRPHSRRKASSLGRTLATGASRSPSGCTMAHARDSSGGRLLASRTTARTPAMCIDDPSQRRSNRSRIVNANRSGTAPAFGNPRRRTRRMSRSCRTVGGLKGRRGSADHSDDFSTCKGTTQASSPQVVHNQPDSRGTDTHSPSRGSASSPGSLDRPTSSAPREEGKSHEGSSGRSVVTAERVALPNPDRSHSSHGRTDRGNRPDWSATADRRRRRPEEGARVGGIISEWSVSGVTRYRFPGQPGRPPRGRAAPPDAEDPPGPAARLPLALASAVQGHQPRGSRAGRARPDPANSALLRPSRSTYYRSQTEPRGSGRRARPAIGSDRP